MNLAGAFARTIPIDDIAPQAPSRLRNRMADDGSVMLHDDTAQRAQRTAKPVLQLAALPIPITPALFAGGRSARDPEGDLRPLFAFSDLVDAVPNFERFYMPSGSSVQATYGAVLHGASADAGSFASEIIAGAEQRYAQAAMADLVGTGGSWYPAFAQPEDWYDMSRLDRFVDIDIDLLGQGGADNAFTVLGGTDAVLLSTGDGQAMQPLSPATKLTGITMKYMSVQIQRPWLSFALFRAQGWRLGTEPPGFCSTGDPLDNDGILPLIPMQMLLGADVRVDARFAAEDQAAIKTATDAGKTVYVGPFGLNAPALHVIGFVSALVPRSPIPGAS